MKKLLLLFLVLWSTVTVADELTRYTDERDLPAVVNPCESNQEINHDQSGERAAPYVLMSFTVTEGNADMDLSVMKPCLEDHNNLTGTKKEPAIKGPGLTDEFDHYLMKY